MTSSKPALVCVVGGRDGVGGGVWGGGAGCERMLLRKIQCRI